MVSSSEVTYINGVLMTTIKELVSLELDKAATSIYGVKDGDYAFFNCKSILETVIVTEGSQLKDIQPYSFYKCTQLKEIDLSLCKSLTTIGEYAFYGCSSLQSVIFPDSLTSINSYAFMNTVLQSVFIPRNVNNIGKYAFYLIFQLKTFTFDENIKITAIQPYSLAYTGIISFTIPRYVSSFSGEAFDLILLI